MSKAALPVLGALFALLCSCTSVTVDRPFGTFPQKLEPGLWNGTWAGEDGKPFEVKVRSAAEGEIEIAGIDEKEGRFVFETHTMLLREDGDWMFLFAGDDEGDDEEDYLWARVRNVDGKFIWLWMPSFERFSEAVTSGGMKGTVGESVVRLSGVTPEQIGQVKSGDGGCYFEWDEPLFFRRIAP